MLFKELNLKSSSLEAIEAMGFKEPSEIQEKSIPLLLEDDVDFIGQAQTGTGKTAAFGLPLLEKIDPSSDQIQSLILAPTRELANQICQEIDRLSQFEPVKTLAVYGGQPVSTQQRALRKDKPQIVVGTPGRVLDFIRRGSLKLETCKFVVLDEADEMLDMGFFDDVNEILSAAGESSNKKIWMFSATMPKAILNLIKKHFADPVLVKTTKKILTADSVVQQFCFVKDREQTEAIGRYLDYHQDIYGIIFARTKIGAQNLADALVARGFATDSLHGDMSQEQRDLTMEKFKRKQVKLLVCTDVAARGIDVTDLTHVINFGLPQDNESYVHRIGRTGRGGSKGIALTLLSPRDARRLRDIERITKAKIEKVELPKLADIKGALREKAFVEFENLLEASRDEAEFEQFKERFGELDKESLLQGAFTFVYNQSLKKYSQARELDDRVREPQASSQGRGGRNVRQAGTQKGYERFFVSVGRNDGVNPGSLIKMVASGASLRGAEVGRIDIKDTFSFMEIPQKHSQRILGLNESWKNKKVAIQVAAPEKAGSGGGSSRNSGRSFKRNTRR